MKKIVDKYLFSKIGLQLVASIFVVLLFSAIAPSCRKAAIGSSYNGFFQFLGWGLKQVSSPAGAVGTFENLDGIQDPGARFAMLVVAICCWVVSIGVFSFITGSIVNWFRNRKALIDAGMVHYKFRDHGIVVGWDFQGASCVRSMLVLDGLSEVLIVSAVSAKEIRRDLKAGGIGSSLMPRVYIYNGTVTASKRNLRDAYPELCRQIVVLGDRTGLDNDGGNLHIERVLREYIKEKRSLVRGNTECPPIKVYLHIEDSVLYTQSLGIPKKGFSEDDELINLEIFNYYESWAWRCFSLKDACDGDKDCSGDGVVDTHDGDAYLPLRWKSDAERVELFIIGSSLMGRAITNYAMPLMNYGEDGKHCKITIFDESSTGGVFLPERGAIEAMPEVDVEFKQIDGGTDEANAIMIAAASDPKTAVTIVIATPGPDAAVRSYAQLANSLRRMDVSILVWQATTTAQCPRKPFLQTCGDRAKLRFFGMTDRLPWKNPARQLNGQAVNYFYDVIFGGIKAEGLPAACDPNLIDVAKSEWSNVVAEERWRGLERWKKWSSINSADSFKEKAAAFRDCVTNIEMRRKFLHAEHNRWWTERLLAGWKLCPKPTIQDAAMRKLQESDLKDAFCHWDMIPFDQLDDFTRDLDKVNIAAMSVRGYFG